MSLFLDISTGAGLASATGVRPYLPPLLAGGLARGDIGIDFDGTDLWWLESPAFLATVLALGVIGFVLERSEATRASPDLGARAARGAAEVFAGVIGLVLAWIYVPRLELTSRSLDWLGVVLSAAGMFCLILGIQEGERFNWDWRALDSSRSNSRSKPTVERR